MRRVVPTAPAGRRHVLGLLPVAAPTPGGGKPGGASARSRPQSHTGRPRATGDRSRWPAFPPSALGGRLREAVQTPQKLPGVQLGLRPLRWPRGSALPRVAPPLPGTAAPINHVHPNPRFRRNRSRSLLHADAAFLGVARSPADVPGLGDPRFPFDAPGETRRTRGGRTSASPAPPGFTPPGLPRRPGGGDSSDGASRNARLERACVRGGFSPRDPRGRPVRSPGRTPARRLGRFVLRLPEAPPHPGRRTAGGSS